MKRFVGTVPSTGRQAFVTTASLVDDAVATFLLFDHQQIALLPKDIILVVMRYYYRDGACTFLCTLCLDPYIKYVRINCRDNFALGCNSVQSSVYITFNARPISEDAITSQNSVRFDDDFAIAVGILKLDFSALSLCTNSLHREKPLTPGKSTRIIHSAIINKFPAIDCAPFYQENEDASAFTVDTQ